MHKEMWGEWPSSEANRNCRMSSTAPSDSRLPTVLPHEPSPLTPRHFNQLLLEQSQCLKISGKASLVDVLEREFRSYMSSVHSESSFSDELARYGPTTGFDDAWRPLGLRFPLLKQF
jgi:hypothetical protein